MKRAYVDTNILVDLVLSRQEFLPEISLLNLNKVAEMNQMWQNLKARQPKGTGINRQSPTYDYEMQRIGKVLNFINPNFKAN